MVDLADARWRKSSHSGPNGGDCVEVADTHGTIAVRDSKNPHLTLALTPTAFSHLTNGLKHLA